jgi:hypothetical protein
MNTREEVMKRILNFFDVTVSVDETDISQQEQWLSVFPNPANKRLTTRFELHQAREVVIEVFDLTGRLITVETSSLSAGIHTRYFDVDAYHPGVYYLRLNAGDKTQTKKWIKVNN